MASQGKINGQGRVVIPAEVREAAGFSEGDQVVFEVLGKGEVRVKSYAQALREAQELIARKVPKGHSLADELIADRRKEAVEE